MVDEDLEFPAAPLSPSLPSDYLEPSSPGRAEPNIYLRSSPAKKRQISKIAPENPGDLQDLHTFDDASVAADSPTPSTQESPKKGSSSTSNASSSGSSSSAGSSKSGKGGAKNGLAEANGRIRPKLTPEDERRISRSRTKMGKWVEKARSKKHESDRASNDRHHRMSTLLAIDSLVCFMIAFDYEDRADAIKNGTPIIGKPRHSRSWSTLVPFLIKVAAKAESVDADLAGVCYLVSAVVGLHVAYLERRTSVPENHVRDLYHSLADFRKGIQLLPTDILRTRYRMDHTSGWSTPHINDDEPDPVNNRAALPLHVNSLLSEAAAFALNVATKWSTQENMNYTWAATEPVD